MVESAGPLGFACHPRVRGDPVDFPRLPPVIREGLLKMARGRRDVGYDKADEDGSAIECFLGKELAAPILELADRGLAHGAAVAACKIEAPLAGLGIVQTQIQTFEVTSRAIGLELYQIGAAIPNLADDRGALIFDPGSRAS